MHDGIPPTPLRLSAAAYLRCYPYDVWRMSAHRRAVTTRALELGFPIPELFLDNGCLSRDPLPELARLLGLVETGGVEVLLIPGPFVFSLDDKAAAETIRRIESHDCTVLQLPTKRSMMTRVKQPAQPAQPTQPGMWALGRCS